MAHPLRILVVGGGSGSGASIMRAEQMAARAGCRVHVDPWKDPPYEWLPWCQCIVIVKRLKKRWNKWVRHVHSKRIPIVWDAVDFWHQPDANTWTRAQHVAAFQAHRADFLHAKGVITATDAMAADCGWPSLPHHHRIGLTATPVRPQVQAVAYEGKPDYLDYWHPALEAACAARGWQFVVNPPSLTDADIVVALRGGVHDGWVTRQWKSGVKYANALAVGRPVITQPTAAFAEMRGPGTVVNSIDDLGPALDEWTTQASRQHAYDIAQALVAQYDVDKMAARFRQLVASFL